MFFKIKPFVWDKEALHNHIISVCVTLNPQHEYLYEGNKLAISRTTKQQIPRWIVWDKITNLPSLTTTNLKQAVNWFITKEQE